MQNFYEGEIAIVGKCDEKMLGLPNCTIYDISSKHGTLGELINIIYFFLIHVRPKRLIVQNAPAIPALLSIIILFPFFNILHTKVAIDWHNLSYTIAKNKKKHRIVVYALMFVEFIAARLYSIQFCVSFAMRKWFRDKWNVNVEHFPDTPFEAFKKTDEKDLSGFVCELDASESDRPITCMSSTSWTPDERFDILAEALLEFDKKFNDDLPHLYLFITGRGPLKTQFEQQVGILRHVKLFMAWLEFKDYCELIRNVDIGLSMHESTSGLDLPMKILDMFGSGIPVISKNYPCIKELVDESNGYLFDTAEELCNLFYTLNVEKIREKKVPKSKTFEENWLQQCAIPMH
jgi:beta-1,4-mannosyltransferase